MLFLFKQVRKQDLMFNWYENVKFSYLKEQLRSYSKNIKVVPNSRNLLALMISQRKEEDRIH